MKLSSALALLAAALAGAACEPGEQATPDRTPAADRSQLVADSPAAAPPLDSAGDVSLAGADTAARRVALPTLYSIMLGLQRDLDRLSAGIWSERYDSIAAAARAVADHPSIPQAEARRIAQVLGDDMSRFQDMDAEVHDRAVRIAGQADAGDLATVLEHDASLRRSCAECHAMFRERLRSAAGEALR